MIEDFSGVHIRGVGGSCSDSPEVGLGDFETADNSFVAGSEICGLSRHCS